MKSFPLFLLVPATLLMVHCSGDRSTDAGGSLDATPDPSSQPASAGNSVQLGDTGLSVTIPDGWETSDKISGEFVMGFYLPPGTAGLHPNFSATLEPHSDTSLPAMSAMLKSLIPDPVINSEGEEDVNGRKVLFIDISNPSPLGELRTLRLLTEMNGKVLVLGFSDQAANFDAAAESKYRGFMKTLK